MVCPDCGKPMVYSVGDGCTYLSCPHCKITCPHLIDVTRRVTNDERTNAN